MAPSIGGYSTGWIPAIIANVGPGSFPFKMFMGSSMLNPEVSATFTKPLALVPGSATISPIFIVDDKPISP
jgi:hypothetical protein